MILKLLKPHKRKVLVHGSNWSAIFEVKMGDIIEPPWILHPCPVHLEPDGTVTLRLEWEKRIKAHGYGKTYHGITWEECQKDKP